MSEKTTRSNAAVVGLGPTRRILLGDTLTGDDADPERLAEARAVLAHELAITPIGDLLARPRAGGRHVAVTVAVAAALLAVLPEALAHGGAGDPASLPAFVLASGVAGAAGRSRHRVALAPAGARRGRVRRTGSPTATRSPARWSGSSPRTSAELSRRG